MAVMKHHDQSNLGRKGFIQHMLLHYGSLPKVPPTQMSLALVLLT